MPHAIKNNRKDTFLTDEDAKLDHFQTKTHILLTRKFPILVFLKVLYSYSISYSYSMCGKSSPKYGFILF